MNETKRMDVMGLLGPMRRYARTLTRDEAQADDLVQDTLVRAFEGSSSFRASGNLRGWLLSILHNTFIDCRRRDAAEARRAQEAADFAETIAPADQESRVRLQQIRQAFMSLPDDQRAVLHLIAIEGMSYQEAADSLGIPVGTLMSRLGRARAALRAFESGVAQNMAGKPRPNLRIVGGSHD
jgi:RNA polymerase sigma factor (sigma-70 family)